MPAAAGFRQKAPVRDQPLATPCENSAMNCFSEAFAKYFMFRIVHG